MATKPLERKLAAILYADVAGYSRLTGEDEEGTHRVLSAYLDAIASSIRRHNGKVLHYAGDAVLSDFATVSDALICAAAVQQDLKRRNKELPDERKVQFRIGVNLGEVIVDRNEIYGDGVNVAARLESLAEPGGICISESVHTAVGNKLPLEYAFIGEQAVKNIAKPVRAYSVTLKPDAVLPAPGTRRKTRSLAQYLMVATAVVLVAVIGVIVWWQPWQIREEPASIARMAFPLPNEPSIAVLPFGNLSGDPEQEYFSDGITNDIITDLSKLKNLFVIAGNSSFSYKDRSVKVQAVSEELGVRYILEGSVQKSGTEVRINTQLIDALTGRHLWAERYERNIDDLFVAQNEIVETVVAALAIKVDAAERERVSRKDTDNLAAYDYYLRGADIRFDWGKEVNERTRQLLEKAIELDPNYARAYAALAWTHVNDSRFGWSEDKDTSKERALEFAQRAIDLDPSDAESYWALGVVHLFSREFDKAMPLYEKAVSLNPNDARLLVGSSPAWVYVGRMNEAIAQIKRGMRLDPHQANNALGYLGWAYYDAKEYEKALSTLKKISNPPAWIHRYLAATYVRLGRLDEARAEAATAIKSEPDYSIEKSKVWPYQDENQRKHYNDAIVQVGIPERAPLPLPDKPSIAVLPFANMSDDPKQEYFADGMTDDLITDLSKISGLFVIARNSTFAYKGRSPDVRRVSRELGVKYVLEGSVRRAGDQVRVNAQLIDATTGGHVWAERYDGTLADVFALQDEVTQKIVTALAVNLTAEERVAQARIETTNPKAYDAFLRGWAHYRRNTPDDFAKAVPYLEKATELDAKYSRAYAALAAVYWSVVDKDRSTGSTTWSRALGINTDESRRREHLNLQEAMKNPTPLAYQVAAGRLSRQGQHETAIAEAGRAIALDPNDPVAYEAMGTALIYAGRPIEAAKQIKQAMRFDPRFPHEYLYWLGLAQFGMERFEDAAETLSKATLNNPDDDRSLILLAATFGHLERVQEAKAAVEKADTLRQDRQRRLIDPSLQLGIDVLLVGPYTLKDAELWPFRQPADRERLYKGLQLAGVPAVGHGKEVSPTKVAGATTVDATLAKSLLDRGALFVDVRGDESWNNGHIPGAVHLYLKTNFREAALSAVVAKDQEVVIYCMGPRCLLSSKACAKAVTWGFEKVYYFREGFPSWKAAGYPIEIPEG